MRKFVYMVKTGQLSKLDNNYHFYETELFTSKKKALARCHNGIDCNKGYDVKTEEFDQETFRRESTQIDYKCLSTEGREMDIRHWIEKIELQ